MSLTFGFIEQDERPSMRPHLSQAARIEPTDVRTEPALVGPFPDDEQPVTDDFGELVAVGPREIEVIETYLGALIDAMLEGE